MLSKIIISLIMIVAGYFIVWKADWFLRNVGAIPSAEKYIRTEGGSRLMYKFIGILFIICGLLYVTGLSDDVLRFIVVNLFGFGAVKQL